MSHSIEKSAELVKIMYWGTLTNDDLYGVVKKSVDSAEFSDRIEDMRKLNDVSIGFKDLLSLVQNIEKMEFPRTIKTAVLTGSALQYGIARMFQTILNHSHMEVKVFTNEEEAHSWISSGE